jgi:hypothetical protein
LRTRTASGDAFLISPSVRGQLFPPTAVEGRNRPRRNRSERNQKSPASCKRWKRAGEESFKGSRPSPEERRDAEGEGDASVAQRCDDRSDSGRWRALYLQKCRERRQSRRRTRHHLLHAVRVFLSSVYRASREKTSTAGSPRGSIAPSREREMTADPSSDRWVGIGRGCPFKGMSLVFALCERNRSRR